MKKDYLVFGKHVPWNETIGFLEVNRDSFVTEWDGTLEKEIDQLEGYCSLNSMIPTPRMSSTITFSSGASMHSVKKATTTGRKSYSIQKAECYHQKIYRTVNISGLNSHPPEHMAMDRKKKI